MLPDEIISEILSPALKVPDHLFSDSSDVSPFATYSVSSSAYLSVCKDWLRVATPLLYHVVVLRSKSQANALEKVLRRSPEFGLFIRKLRVEGGYGPAMLTILKASPNVKDLFVSFSIWSSDSTVGLCSGLPLLNPKRVILHEPCLSKRPLQNKHLDALRKTLSSCIQKWDSLEIFSFPYGYRLRHHSWGNRAREVIDWLVRSSSIRTIQLPMELELWIPSHIVSLTRIPSLKAIEIMHPVCRELAAVLDAEPKFKALVRYTLVEDPVDDDGAITISGPDITPSLNPFYVPLASVSEETRNVIWQRILFFALDVAERRDRSSTFDTLSSYLSILAVSKFVHDLALPYLYDTVNITVRNAVLIAKQLEERPGLGSSIRVIYMPYKIIPRDFMAPILAAATNLQSILPRKPDYLGDGVDLTVFEALAIHTGSSLRELRTALRTNEISASLFAPFTELRVLEIRTDAGSVKTASKHLSSSNGLNLLHTLHIRGWLTDVLDAIKGFRLDALRTLTLSEFGESPSSLINFIKVHGEKLAHLQVPQFRTGGLNKTVVLDYCPNLVELEFRGEYDAIQMAPQTKHNSLKKLMFWKLPSSVTELDLPKFPALQEIQLSGLTWPTSEREINKSSCVAIAESVLLKRGIKFADSTGKYWAPRVKSARERKG
ncbi:F-box domain-containing protein [Favolaschia claudopus]|uniref:F-box domain-containing protein n=1 Tax=Favolaschia claudopus TaxID=2862362 RepID=A0AAW0DNL4_9AGAR